MTRQILWLSVALSCFYLPAYSQNTTPGSSYTYEGTLTQEDIDQSVLYGAPQDPASLEEGKAYMDQIIVPNDYQATTGCLLVQERTWNGTTGGQCANGIDGTYTFGYGQTVIAQTQDAIAEALKVAGITVVGYRWQWRVKNADTNYEDSNGALGQDPLLVRVIVKDKNGEVLDEREWDYSYHIDNWEQKYGMHWYDPFISGDKIDTITLEVEAYDAGYWAGYYGPEFGSAAIYSILVVEPETQDCSDPLLDPTCPGYADALAAQQDEMIELINDVTSEETTAGGEDVAFIADVAQTVEESIIEEVERSDESNTGQNTEVTNEVIEEPSDGQEEESTQTETEADSDATSGSQRVDALSVAQNAVSEALSDANSNIQSTLNSTAQSAADAQSTFENNEQQLQQLSQSQMAETEQAQEFIQNQSIQDQVSITEESVDSIQSQSIEIQNTDVTSQDLSVSTELSVNGETTQQSQGQMTQSDLTQQSMDGSFGSNAQGLDSAEIDIQMGNLNNTQEINNMNQLDNLGLADPNTDIGDNEIVIEVTVDSFKIAALDLAINDVFQAALNRNMLSLSEESEEEEQKSIEEQNAEEDALVEQALSGDDSEDAQAALLGYNPEFRAYQTPQLPDGQFYESKEIYDGQENYDNPNQRFFNGASDATHREMVRQQYER